MNEQEILSYVWSKEEMIKENLLKTTEVKEVQEAIWKFFDDALPPDSIAGLRYQKLKQNSTTWWSDQKGYPNSGNPWQDRIQPFLNILEQYMAEKTIKKTFSDNKYFVDARSQGENVHVFIGMRDRTGNRAHIILDAAGMIRFDKRDQAPEEVVEKIDALFTLKNGKEVRLIRELREG